MVPQAKAEYGESEGMQSTSRAVKSSLVGTRTNNASVASLQVGTLENVSRAWIQHSGGLGMKACQNRSYAATSN
jgi:hypothetical protein